MFKKIEGYDNYEVSDEGQVRNIKTGRILKPIKHDRYGHVGVKLYKNKLRKFLLIHRLVLEAFVCPRPPNMEGCHNNGIPFDNRLENLKWKSHFDNVQDSVKHGTHFMNIGEKNGRAKLTEKQIKEIRAKYKYRSRDANTITLAKEYGVCKAEIHFIVSNKLWKYVNREEGR